MVDMWEGGFALPLFDSRPSMICHHHSELPSRDDAPLVVHRDTPGTRPTRIPRYYKHVYTWKRIQDRSYGPTFRQEGISQASIDSTHHVNSGRQSG